VQRTKDRQTSISETGGGPVSPETYSSLYTTKWGPVFTLPDELPMDEPPELPEDAPPEPLLDVPPKLPAVDVDGGITSLHCAALANTPERERYEMAATRRKVDEIATIPANAQRALGPRVKKERSDPSGPYV
jgi:hypothetical protein